MPESASTRERASRPSPRPMLQASQADKHPWEVQLVSSKPTEATQPPRAYISAATEASADSEAEQVVINFLDLEGLDWTRVSGSAPPLCTPRGKPSWIFEHGWRIWKKETIPERLFFLCKYCHKHRQPGGATASPLLINNSAAPATSSTLSAKLLCSVLTLTRTKTLLNTY